MKATILSPDDVVSLSGFDPGFAICKLQELYNIEYKEFRRCLGFDLWRSMLAALAWYPDAVKFEQGVEYEIDDVVVFRGILSAAVRTTTDTPDNRKDWRSVDKFTGDAADLYDDLYCKFIGPYLALTVVARRLPFVWTQIQPGGVLQYDGGEFATADPESYDRLLSAIHSNRNDVFSNLEHHVDRLIDGDEEPEFLASDVCQYLKGWPGLPDETDPIVCGCNRSGCNTCKRGRKVTQRYRFG